MKQLSQYSLIALVSLFFVLTSNYAFFHSITNVYPFVGKNILFIGSIGLLLFLCNFIFLTLFSSRWTTKIILILTLMISAFTSYFMNTYNVVINDEMIRNVLQTNANESMDLFSWKLIFYVLFLGLIPSFFIWKTPLKFYGFKGDGLRKIGFILLSLTLIVLIILPQGGYFASFFREYKPLRYQANPLYWIYSTAKFSSNNVQTTPLVVMPHGTDAKIPKTPEKTLVIMVVGESLRADMFGFNEKQYDTTPRLAKETDLVNFPNMHSCGTSTAYSVPCMFSQFGRSAYSYKKAQSNENILDVLTHAGVKVLWRDNNSDSKGVALRVQYEDFKTTKNNQDCDIECRDIGMLKGLKHFIAHNKQDNILIVLHQMGNHGPEYFKRYPKGFEKFQPVCKTNQLESCSPESIRNAYANATLYTDYFLDSTIQLLKSYSSHYKTALLYMSDHGENLGEDGVYLHGLPYLIAPDAQTHVASFLWLGKDMQKRINEAKLKAYASQSFNQDYVYSTLLDLFDVKTNAYNPTLDILKPAVIGSF